MSLKDYILQSNFNSEGLQEIGQNKFESANLNRYSQVAQQSYQPERQNFDKFTFDSNLSTEEIAVFDSPNEVSIGLRGTTTYGDLASDVYVTFNDYGSGRLSNRIADVQKKINTIKNNNVHGKKITIAGHSLGGSIAGQISKDNPDLNVYTFNKGSSINPFPTIYENIYENLLGSTGQKRSNLKNYRISGDVASFTSKFNPFNRDGENFTISPLKPTPDMKTSSEGILAAVKKVTDFEPFGISKSIYNPEYYLAHSLGNFVNRSQKNGS